MENNLHKMDPGSISLVTCRNSDFAFPAFTHGCRSDWQLFKQLEESLQILTKDILSKNTGRPTVSKAFDKSMSESTVFFIV